MNAFHPSSDLSEAIAQRRRQVTLAGVSCWVHGCKEAEAGVAWHGRCITSLGNDQAGVGRARGVEDQWVQNLQVQSR